MKCNDSQEGTNPFSYSPLVLFGLLAASVPLISTRGAVEVTSRQPRREPSVLVVNVCAFVPSDSCPRAEAKGQANALAHPALSLGTLRAVTEALNTI